MITKKHLTTHSAPSPPVAPPITTLTRLPPPKFSKVIQISPTKTPTKLRDPEETGSKFNSNAKDPRNEYDTSKIQYIMTKTTKPDKRCPSSNKNSTNNPLLYNLPL